MDELKQSVQTLWYTSKDSLLIYKFEVSLTCSMVLTESIKRLFYSAASHSNGSRNSRSSEVRHPYRHWRKDEQIKQRKHEPRSWRNTAAPCNGDWSAVMSPKINRNDTVTLMQLLKQNYEIN
jgi:preprotein translocase subunit SecA